MLLRKVFGGEARTGKESTTTLLWGLSAYVHAARALPGPLLLNAEGLLEVGDPSWYEERALTTPSAEDRTFDVPLAPRAVEMRGDGAHERLL